nr:YlmC/YmxH family sporulation protein [Ruminococcus flavefaciens]
MGLRLCFDDICRKEVIDMTSGERLGFIDDIELDIESGSVTSLIIYGGQRLFGLLGRTDDTVLSCSEIKVVGEDIILVERSSESPEMKWTKKRRNSLSSLLK